MYNLISFYYKYYRNTSLKYYTKFAKQFSFWHNFHFFLLIPPELFNVWFSFFYYTLLILSKEYSKFSFFFYCTFGSTNFSCWLTIFHFNFSFFVYLVIKIHFFIFFKYFLLIRTDSFVFKQFFFYINERHYNMYFGHVNWAFAFYISLQFIVW